MKNILWGYDGSEESKYALKYALHFAGLYNSKITGVFVNTLEMPISDYYTYYGHYIDDAISDRDKDFKLRFSSISGHLSSNGIKFKSKIVRGEADEEILNVSDNEKADFIVMGVTGRSLLGRMLIGSTTLKVLRKSKVPLLAVKKLGSANKVKIKKILVPIDISEKSESALKYAMELASKLRCHITFIFVINVYFNMHEFPPDILDEMVKGSSNELKNLIKSVTANLNGKLSSKIKSKVVFGFNAGLKIADYAKRNKFDLIVMNTRGRKDLKRFILGSVTEQVIRSSNCPVLGLKP